MDQDSFFSTEAIQNLFFFFNSYEDKKNLGILTPFHATQLSRDLKFDYTSRELKITMTSGNIISLKAWKTINGFKENYFIDFVDHEYSLRLRKNGYKIIECSNSMLTHALGDLKKFNFLGRTFSTSNHNYIRRYYITRNRLSVMKDYFMFDSTTCIKDLYFMFAEFFKIIIEEEDKSLKIKSFVLGIKDFMIGRYGKKQFK